MVLQSFVSASRDQFWIGIRNYKHMNCKGSQCNDQLVWQVGSATCPFDLDDTPIEDVIYNQEIECARLRTFSMATVSQLIFFSIEDQYIHCFTQVFRSASGTLNVLPSISQFVNIFQWIIMLLGPRARSLKTNFQILICLRPHMGSNTTKAVH